MTKQSEKHIDSPHGPHPRFDEAGELSIASMQSLAESPVKFALQWSEQWAKFARLRFDRDQEFIGSLAECRDWVGISKLQATWLCEALEDYFLEGREVAELARKQTTEAFARVPGAET